MPSCVNLGKVVPIVLFSASLTAMALGQVVHFVPKNYTTEFSNRSEPVLHLKPGETVVTTCVDSDGHDAKGKLVTTPPNPLTGPFFVDGAEPGDTLEVKLERIWLTRKTGIQSTGISYAAVTPEYLLDTPSAHQIIKWTFDFKSMTAMTDWSPRFKALKLTLRPFLGCLGVAPGSAFGVGMPQAISAMYAGSYGGNLDYNRLVEGTTVFLPVSVPGAYFALGDGHAAEGDGETSGGAIETSMGVQFKVSLLKHKNIPSVRAETDQYYIAIGTGGSLERATQVATTNLLDWLIKDFKLTPQEAQVLLGMRARYDIVSMASPHYFIVACRIRKDLVKTVDSTTTGPTRQ